MKPVSIRQLTIQWEEPVLGYDLIKISASIVGENEVWGYFVSHSEIQQYNIAKRLKKHLYAQTWPQKKQVAQVNNK